MSDRIANDDWKRRVASIIKVNLMGLACAVLVASCGRSDPLLNPDPLAPFVQARYSVEGAIATFKQEFQPTGTSDSLSETDWNKYRRGRQLYNQAASAINAVIVQVMLANQTRTELSEVDFKQRLATAINQAAAFREYAETVRRERPGADGSSSQAQPFYFSVPINPIGVPDLLNSIFGQINTALGQARNAEQDKRDRIEGVLRSLLLPPFDETGKRAPDSFSPPSRRSQ
ncbi:MAG: hypothetical protein KME42_13520 [Tildeniella nuda ZEHNDER 1965/U140]|jgi:hypothetical protein|nr:hypothetical protein [Tildeniella nuda ZEHNDER 1965/U140]